MFNIIKNNIIDKYKNSIIDICLSRDIDQCSGHKRLTYKDDTRHTKLVFKVTHAIKCISKSINISKIPLQYNF